MNRIRDTVFLSTQGGGKVRVEPEKRGISSQSWVENTIPLDATFNFKRMKRKKICCAKRKNLSLFKKYNFSRVPEY
jgi:hypothetical protein